MGAFVVLEGPEGAGKSSQARVLVERLLQLGYSALLAREPGGTALGDAVREIVLPSNSISISPRSEVLLYCASRAQLVEDVIRPAIDRGDVVVCDRFSPSTIAYQGYGRQMDVLAIESTVRFAVGNLDPDLCILLDLESEVGLQRKYGDFLATGGDQWNRFEQEELAFHRRVREGYLRMAEANPDSWVVLDGSLPFGTLQDRIIGEVSSLLDRKQLVRRLA